MNSKRTILVTGGDGFIGTHLTQSLGIFGCEIIAISLRDGDLTEPGMLDKRLMGVHVDGVIHCASLRPKPGLDFDAYYRGNVLTLCRVLDWMVLRNVKKILTFSSVNVYGNVHGTVLNEESPTDPVGDYAVSKWTADQILKCRARERGLTAANLRLPTVFGVGQTGIVETCRDQALRNEEIELFSSGKLMRNLISIDQLMEACRRTLERWGNWSGYHLFLLGSSNSLTMETIARRIVDKTGSRSKISLVEKPAPADADWLFCLDHAKRMLGFEPMPLERALDLYMLQGGRGKQ